MQNKKSRKAAREVNVFLDPSLKEEGDWVKKNGKRIPKRKRELSGVIECIDHELTKKIKGLPKGISPFHYLTIKRSFDIAYRDNKTEKEVKCPECKNKFNVEIPHVKAEANSISSMNALLDRTFPKLQHLSQEINLTGYMNEIVSCITQLVVVYVPYDKKPEAMAKINQMFEKLIEREAGVLIEQQTQVDANKLLESVA